MTGKYLITTDGWFYAPNGKQYKAVWGDVTVLNDSILGVKTNRNASNWFVKVGTDENHVIVAGCQIHYACKTNEEPHVGSTEDYILEGGKVSNYIRPTNIYIAQ